MCLHECVCEVGKYLREAVVALISSNVYPLSL